MIPSALTIAGSDSGGGAGVQADLKTFAALEVHGLSAFTALTAQSTVEVRGVHPVPAGFVRLQVETVLDDFGTKVAKTGMLFSAEIIRVVAALISERGLTAVVDPVMVAESGATLLPDDAKPALLEALIPRARLVTPNLPELFALTGCAAESLDEMVDAGRMLLERGAGAVLVKGGHRRGDPIDVLLEEREVWRYGGARIETTSTHGTGCTYAAAIAAYLARGEALEPAVCAAHRYLQSAIAAGRPGLGRGRGPVHHMFAYYAWRGPVA